jgi:hypothetical protein
LWDTRKEVFSVVGYNRRGFPPLWDTIEEVLYVAAYDGRGFFLLWDTMEETFKCLSLPSNEIFGKPAS